MDIGRPTTTTEAQSLMGMVQYYRYIFFRWSHVLVSLTEPSSGPKGRNVLCNENLESSFKE